MHLDYYKPAQLAGFTLTEILCTLAIFGIFVSLAMSAFFAVTRENVISTAQADLDLDARHIVERLRSDLWRTSSDEILLYPGGPGPHTAISFPIMFGQEDAVPVRNEDGSIDWDAETVYHLWEGPPAEVRRTVISPRPQIAAAARSNLLQQVASDGNAAKTEFSSQASTRTLIRNLVDWRLNIAGPTFDGYAPTPGRRHVGLGTYILPDGVNHFTFRMVGNNSNSTGHRVGIDWLAASPSGSRREGELQTSSDISGGTIENVVRTDGQWSGNHFLRFNGSSDSEFTLRMENDRWEEVNLFHTSAFFDDGITRIFDETASPKTFALQLRGNQTVWQASEQTGHAGGSVTDFQLEATAVRVLLRGADLMADSGFITTSGTNAWFTFRNGASLRHLRIAEPYIALSDPSENMNYIGPRIPIMFAGDNAARISPLSALVSDPTPILIDANQSYIVGFFAYHPDESAPTLWRRWDGPAGVTQSYIVRDADTLLHNQSDWTSVTNAVATSHVYALQSVFAGYAPEGVYRSRIFDTRNDTLNIHPNYGRFSWSAYHPVENTQVEVRIRTGSEPDLSDALDWDNISPANNEQTLNTLGRYAQVQVTMRPGGDHAEESPLFRDFTLRWEAEERAVDIGGMFSTGPDHGIVELLINGRPMIQAVTVNLAVFKDVMIGVGAERRFESSVYAEIGPRNTRSEIEEL